MNIAFRDLCTEYNIPVATETDKHYRTGWIQIECPFCTGNPGFHLGWSINEEYFNCWRCGWKSPEAVVAILTGVKGSALTSLLSEYQTESHADPTSSHRAVKGGASRLKLPACGKLGAGHKRYLLSRGFDPVLLQRLWDLRGSNGVGRYRNRIIAPIYFGGRMVSYQGRDITGTQELRYKACPIEKEVVHHKHVLYGWDQCEDSVVVVEGITDVWRLGYGSVATFGIKYTVEQLELIGRKKRRYILFDTEDIQAREQGKLLANQLSLLPGTTEYIELDKHCKWIDKKAGRDPANLTQKCADAIMKSLT